MNFKEIQNGVTYLINNDKKLAKVITAAGKCNLKPHRNYYLSLLEAIIGQQLSVKAASSIYNKFTAFFLEYPTPINIIETPHEILRGLGLSNAKVRYVKDLAEKVEDGTIHFNKLNKLSDEQIIQLLTKVKGIGIWTAHMFLIFTLGRPNVLPTGDLGIKKAIQRVYELDELPQEEGVEIIAAKYKWDPYCSLASWYLWKSLEF
ncbi:MAG: DNA-3-methyladenine glycosylase [Bacteroidota bacterium]|nr:DNA-3-methyladenine glycosylase [Bacteroidota bacterium]